MTDELIVAEPRGLAVVPDTERPVAGPPDLMAHMMAIPVEQMQAQLSEYWDRRKAFRAWLHSHLTQGVHFGYPPGLEPKFDKNGNVLTWDKKKKQEVVIRPDQWTMKPSLFKAGAQFICSLCYVTPQFEADMQGWEQLGKPKDTFVYACRIISKANGQVLGQGRGVHRLTEWGDPNNGIKMAQKRALVDAVINTYGLADLFTQDLEDKPKDPHPNPTADPTKPKQPARAQRVTKEELGELHVAWQEVAFDAKDSDEFFKLIHETTGREFNPRKPGEWTRDDFTKVADAIRLKRDGEAPPQ